MVLQELLQCHEKEVHDDARKDHGRRRHAAPAAEPVDGRRHDDGHEKSGKRRAEPKHTENRKSGGDGAGCAESGG